MKILAISDLHIVSEGDEAHQFYLKFIDLSLKSDAEIIVLLGDIFDIMVGEQKGYTEDYDWYFRSIEKLINADKKVYFFEGNHDFHLERIFCDVLKKSKNYNNFTYVKSAEKFVLDGKTTYFMHGDDLDLDNEGYKRWKKIYSSTPFKLVVNKILPYWFVKYLGAKASKDSKHRNRPHFNYEEFKKKYREKAEKFFENNPTVDILVAGHTHIKDIYTINDKTYVNAGFPKRDNSYIQITKNSIEVLEI